ncbi:methylglyoxal synthase [Terasakiella sp. A23]|uniref:methylglyoxal synthase n=1 Tax=Terasakiella sp. FCG-A23 TaxID=3080561 RepID=UPI00295509AD|nr:methylglyoxal synthase [Terasakiella sp. A23]MDV7340586.1 methylglyoxal synthase [Terasakiella sp. A23]
MIVRPLNIGLVAHDAMKDLLAGWVDKNKNHLRPNNLFATGTTSRILSDAHADLEITALKSGPLGGDQQLGALICEGKLDALVFFQDPMTAQPHDVDVKALVRMSTLYDVALACNPATADLIITNPDFFRIASRTPESQEKNWQKYINRDVKEGFIT